MVGLQ